ncbi:MAG: D-glycero-beta-D-manno-heptose-7-phosphate kinase [Oligoflexia bacterium]|nr:D-glycero-beta-D-manno-heptose-7-phosphate kinase [Oligoflexia bacterium]
MAKYRIEAIHPSHWNLKRLRELLHRKLFGRILVIGDVGLDRYTIGAVERISPEAPVPIVHVREEKLKLGLAANVADNIQTLGGEPWLVGLVGKDAAARDFRKMLRSTRIGHGHLVEDASRRTVLKERVVSERQQLLRVDYEDTHPISREMEEAVLAKVEELAKRADAVIVEDYAKGLINQRVARQIFAAAKRNGKIVTVDPNLRTPVEVYRGASVLTPNTNEAERLSGVQIRGEASLIQAGSSILRAANARHVVITRGKDGMAIFSAGRADVRLIPTYAKEVYDVSGAGDTVISVLTLALAGGATIEEAAVLGNLAAGVEVGKRGTATVTPLEIESALEFLVTGSAARAAPGSVLAGASGAPVAE